MLHTLNVSKACLLFRCMHHWYTWAEVTDFWAASTRLYREYMPPFMNWGGDKIYVIDTETDVKSMNWPSAFSLFLYFAANLYSDCKYEMEFHLMLCPRCMGGSLVKSPSSMAFSYWYWYWFFFFFMSTSKLAMFVGFLLMHQFGRTV